MKYLKIPERFTDDEKEELLNVRFQYGREEALEKLQEIRNLNFLIRLVIHSAMIQRSIKIAEEMLKRNKLI